MNDAVRLMLDRYECKTQSKYEGALKEIVQEIALLGLWRAKFYEHAAFYGGTALRILHGLNRFSEDLDFSLLRANPQFRIDPYLKAIENELRGMGFEVVVEKKEKANKSSIESGFIKAGTKIHMLKIQPAAPFADQVQHNSRLVIKVEVDTDPPPGFQTEAITLLQPIPFSVRVYRLPDLFAGKVHAVLQRAWKTRVKGRDYYDFVWYLGREVPLRLSHLEARLRQSGAWGGERGQTRGELTAASAVDLLRRRIESLDIGAARRDVLPFVHDPAALDLWSREFFMGLLEKIKFI